MISQHYLFTKEGDLLAHDLGVLLRGEAYHHDVPLAVETRDGFLGQDLVELVLPRGSNGPRLEPLGQVEHHLRLGFPPFHKLHL
jgi:hypothetical protein